MAVEETDWTLDLWVQIRDSRGPELELEEDSKSARVSQSVVVSSVEEL